MKLVSAETSADVRIENGVASIDGRRVEFRRLDSGGGALRAIEIGGRVFPVRLARSGESVEVWCGGAVVQIERGGAAAARHEVAADLLSPMPGRLRRVAVAVGQRVARGEPVLVLEAMKMEHVIRAPREGRIAKLFFEEGELVEAGARLAEIAE